MALFLVTRPYTHDEKERAIAHARSGATPDRDYYLLVAGAVVFALCGIFLDSIPVLIGAMIVAPLAGPILGLSLGLARGEWMLVARSGAMLVASLLIAFVISSIGVSLLGPLRADSIYITFVAHPFFDLLIAFVAGIIAAYGLMRERVGNAMVGVGVAISLMPPLVATAVALAEGLLPGAEQAFLIFMFNVIGIIAGSALIFITFGLNRFKI